MRKYEDPNLLDYRYGGDRLGDFAEKYMRTLAYVFDALNELDATDIDHYLFKLEDNTIYVRDVDGEEWIKFIEIDTDGSGNKILLFNGSASLWGGKAHHLNNLQDGQVLVWSEAEHAFVNQNQVAPIDMKKLIIKRGDNVVTEYDGSERVVFDDKYPNATTSQDGLMSAADKSKLDNINIGNINDRLDNAEDRLDNAEGRLDNAENKVNVVIPNAINNAIATHNSSATAHQDIRNQIAGIGREVAEASSEIQKLWGNDLIEKADNELTLSNGQTGYPVRMILTEDDEITFGDNEFFTKNLEYDSDGNVMPKLV
jgi:hypothetical protein